MGNANAGVKNRKIISVTGKRQITIPLRFYERLKLGDQVECFMEDGALVIRPLAEGDDDGVSVEILKKLVARGVKGDKLVAEFAHERERVRVAVGVMKREAGEIASGVREGASAADVFGRKGRGDV
ncbi:MAG TPA: AbrB/MazE/SpoVT family DNA-binding domain-containing protein [bacterium]|nr:AbrB/MazE/SpoVT family DNA-binding domain-containing protein [bacterium]